jgi:hypothetical protein
MFSKQDGTTHTTATTQPTIFGTSAQQTDLPMVGEPVLIQIAEERQPSGSLTPITGAMNASSSKRQEL